MGNNSIGSITMDVKVEGLEEAKASAEGLVQAIEKAISLAGELAKIVSNLEVKVTKAEH